MANTEYENLLHPSMLQINYLLELEKIGKKRGRVALIADTCGVSHGPVSRFFKECIGRGYLTEQYEFTDEGERALFIYKKILRDVRMYLKKMEIPETEIPGKIIPRMRIWGHIFWKKFWTKEIFRWVLPFIR